MYIREAVVSSLVFVGQFLVIDSQLMKNGRLQIMDVHWILDNIDAVVIRSAMENPFLIPPPASQ